MSAIDIKNGTVKDILSLLASNFRPVRSHLLNGVRGYARTPFSCSKVSGERNKSLPRVFTTVPRRCHSLS